MTDEIRPIQPIRPRERRAEVRRGPERRTVCKEDAFVPPEKMVAVVERKEPESGPDPEPHPAAPAAPRGPDPAFAAQLIGQSGQKRGLRGGPPVLDAARSTYLGAEYSGGRDRRPSTGVTKKTDV